MRYSSLEKRMKDNYEKVTQTKLLRRTPVIIRIDGKAFHTFTHGFDTPFDDILITSMQETTKYLCKNIQGCVLGYTQSDEISLVLTDYKNLETAAWFDYRVQKVCSIAASMTTLAFNRNFTENVKLENYKFTDETIEENGETIYNPYYKDKRLTKLWYTHNNAAKIGALFDARAFNVPKEEVTNYIYSRQLDASRNSIQMVGQANFSVKELYKKNCTMIKEMLQTKNINWDDYEAYKKYGSCIIKTEENNEITKDTHLGDNWIIDKSIPVFKNEGRQYIEKLIYFD